MTTNEFVKAVENLGYEAEKDEECITIRDKNISLACVFTNEAYRINSNFYGMDWGEKGGVIFALIFQYACTPIEDREEEKEKRYYLKHKWISDKTVTYLKFDREYNCNILYLYIGKNLWKKEFTKEEIKGFKQTFNTDLNDFEIVEVEDED